MKNKLKALVWILLLGIVATGCEEEDIDLEYNNIRLECINRLTRSPLKSPFAVRIDSQEELDSLFIFRLSEEIIIPHYMVDSLNMPRDSIKAKIIEEVKSYPNAIPGEIYDIFVTGHGYDFTPFTWLKDCHDPDIDFDRYTLLGQSLFTGGCGLECQETVFKNKDTKEISYFLNIHICGTCKVLIPVYSWVLVDKLPKEYQVNYQINKKNIGKCN